MDFSPKHHHYHHRSGWRCIFITAAVLLVLGVFLSILGVTVFRVRGATTIVNSVRLISLHAGFDVVHLTVELNATLDLDITAFNPNQASFKYSDGYAELYYSGILVGEAAIPPGEVAAQGSVRTEVILTVFAGRLISNSKLYSDVISGAIVFTTCTTIPGRVTVFGILKRHVVTYSTCDVVVNIISRTVRNTACSYRAEF